MILQAGHRIELELDTDRVRGHIYASSVVQRARGHIFVTHPCQDGRYLPVRAGMGVIIGVAHDDEWVTLEADVVQSFLIEARSVLELTWPRQVSAIPLALRSGRFDVDIPALAEPLGEQGHAGFDVRVVDISRVGLGAESPEPLQPGTSVRLRISIGPAMAPAVIGVVRRCVVKGLATPRRWVLGVEFDPASTDWFARSAEYLEAAVHRDRDVAAP